MAKTWRKARTADEARAGIVGELPIGSETAAARRWLAEQGIDYVERDGALRFKVKGPSSGLFVGVTWLVALHLDGGRLSQVEVAEGLTGP